MTMKMTRRVVGATIVLVMTVPFRASAQSVRLAVHGGWHSSNYASENAPNGDKLGPTDRRNAFNLGLALDVVRGRFFARTGVDYSRRGFTATATTPHAAARLDYLDVPLVVGLRLAGSGNVTPRLYAGPWIGFEIGCDIAALAAGGEVHVDCDDPDGLNERKKTDWGVAIGGGLEFNGPGTVILLVDGRYMLGLQNLDTAPTNENVQAKSRSFTIGFGAAIPIGGR